MNQLHPRHRAFGFATLAVAALAIQACATKGYVREQVRAQSITTQAEVAAARDSAIRAAEMARQTADADLERRINTRTDSQITAQVAALKADLEALRTEFNAKITVMENSINIGLPVNFAFNDATVSETAKPVLQRFADVAKKYYPESQITIEGFADPAGSISYNVELSRRRAAAVQTTLVEMGMNGTNLKTVGYGETRLVTPRASKDDPGAELNRRVVFAIETAGSPIRATALRDY
jgi:peptidoglycan-associated lipoprotein